MFRFDPEEAVIMRTEYTLLLTETRQKIVKVSLDVNADQGSAFRDEALTLALEQHGDQPWSKPTIQGRVSHWQGQREPRWFPLDSPEPRENGLRVRSEVNQVVFRYSAIWGRWVAEQDSGGDGNNYSWNALNSSDSAYATGKLVEVLS
ncbi:MAG TPA: hypothetical protein VE476_01075 [Propionibacteriaceae bacterium]|nr:hypothetical protein [Propionibacteriaceae bacterium]